jgi:hypothetical protein
VAGDLQFVSLNGTEFSCLNNIYGVVVKTGGGKDTIHVGNTLAPVTIDAGPDNDMIDIEYISRDLGGVKGNVLANAGAGLDTINIWDDVNGDAPIYTMTANSLHRTGMATITYNGFNNGINIHGSYNALVYDIYDTSIYPTTLFAGTWDNTVNVLATHGPLSIYGQSGHDAVKLGNIIRGVQDLQGAVSISNAGSFTDLTVDDRANATPRMAVLTDSSLAGLAPATISWVENDLHSLTIRGGSGGNTFTVQDTPQGGYQAVTALDSGLGVDTVYVRGTTGALTVNGQDGEDFVYVGLGGRTQWINGDLTVKNTNSFTTLDIQNWADPLPQMVTVMADTVIGMAPVNIHFVEADLHGLTLWGGTGGNQFAVLATLHSAPGAGTTIFSGTGADVVRVWATNGPLGVYGQNGKDQVYLGAFDTVQGIQGEVHVANVYGYSALIVQNGSDWLPRTVTLTPNHLQGLAPAAITWTVGDLDYLTVYGGDGGNTYTVAGVPSSVKASTIVGGLGADVFAVTSPLTNHPLTLQGGGGVDTAHGPNVATDWTISGANMGSFSSGPFSFVGVENLTGGSAADTFHVQPGGSLTGMIDGGGGTNTLDYSFFETAVQVNLPLGTATALGGIANIQNVTGGFGNDTLVGNAAANVLKGGYGRDLLIGGGGADTLDGQGDSNLLIGGTTSYDTDAAALAAIMKEWSRTDLSLAGRVDHLKKGGGFNGSTVLDSAHVFDDAAIDTVMATIADWNVPS